MTNRTKMLLPQVARYTVGGMRESKICAHLNMSSNELDYIKSLPEFKIEQDNILRLQISRLDKALATNPNVLRQEFKTAIPTAVRALVEAATQQRDLAARVRAAGEILDRDPDRQFTKGASVPLDVNFNEESLRQAGEFADSDFVTSNVTNEDSKSQPQVRINIKSKPVSDSVN